MAASSPESGTPITTSPAPDAPWPDKPGFQPGFVNAFALDNRIRPCEVNVLKDTDLVRLFTTVILNRPHAVFIENNDFPRFYISDVLSADRVQCACLRSNDIGAVFLLPVTQRTHSSSSRAAISFRRRHYDQGKCSFQRIHRPVYRIFDGISADAFLGNNVEITSVSLVVWNMDPSASRDCLSSKELDQIPVVCQSHPAFVVVDHNRLGIQTVIISGGSVPHVAYGHVSLAQVFQYFRSEYVVHKSVSL